MHVPLCRYLRGERLLFASFEDLVLAHASSHAGVSEGKALSSEKGATTVGGMSGASSFLTRSHFLALLRTADVLDTAKGAATGSATGVATGAATGAAMGAASGSEIDGNGGSRIGGIGAGSGGSSSGGGGGLSLEEAGRVFDLLDTDGDGVVSVGRCAAWWRGDEGTSDIKNG